jgi:hypothetical protein
MTDRSTPIPAVDRVLEEWGDRLFRRARGSSGDDDAQPAGFRRRGRTSAPSGAAGSGNRGGSGGKPLSASAVRSAIRDTVRPGSRQVMVKITGGAKGLKPLMAHVRYISRQGKDEAGGRGQTLDVIDERGDRHQGAAAIRQLVEDWRVSGSYIPEESTRKEAFHIIFSMPQGTRAEALQEAVTATAAQLYEGHRYAMVMHLNQGAPHVHVVVRAERRDGRRLNPRKADLDRWRSTFARELQSRGIDAVATRQVARLRNRAHPSLWEVKARDDGRLKRQRSGVKNGAAAQKARLEALQAWREISTALARSPDPSDRALAAEAAMYLAKEVLQGRGGRTAGREKESAQGGRAAPSDRGQGAADRGSEAR